MNDTYIIVFSMIFIHIIADFNIQGILGDLKQKQWWNKNYPQEKYKYDYITSLIIHSFTWSFMIMVPLVIYYKTFSILLLLCNIFVHSIIDDIKANKLLISLTVDQILHIAQIIITYIIYCKIIN